MWQCSVGEIQWIVISEVNCGNCGSSVQLAMWQRHRLSLLLLLLLPIQEQSCNAPNQFLLTTTPLNILLLLTIIRQLLYLMFLKLKSSLDVAACELLNA